ncbi:MAG: sulfite exporter TauE/SafE family protein [Planctomycetaceae bacterium]|nr:sulfite exporter TauE/SafE family protein [Planctomycetaceae bacterium]
MNTISEVSPSSAASHRSRLAPFFLWLALFYTSWLSYVVIANQWEALRTHWPISVAMAFGSYIAGSTPMGGGTVGFPVLVLLFDQPATLGRNFGLAVQSIGMVSASIYILSSRQHVDWPLLRPALLGSLVGTIIGCTWIAPVVSDLWIQLTFGIIWASFGIMHLLRMRELVSAQGVSYLWRTRDWPLGLLIGVLGGIVASITGVGIDMLIYAVLVLLYRADLKIAIPTSVILMAFTSVVGITTNHLLAAAFPDRYSINPEVFANWLAAAPVVAVGAPFGAIVVNLISRTPTLILVSILCVVQFVWTLVDAHITGWPLVVSLLAVAALVGVFHWLYRLGERASHPERL